MNGFLLDTNIPSELTSARSDAREEEWLEAARDDDLYLSAVSLGEIAKGIALLPEGKRRNELERWVEEKLRPWFSGRILSVTPDIAERWGRLAALRQLQGTPISVADGLIAATALEHGLTVVTGNVRDFEGLNVIVGNPWGPV